MTFEVRRACSPRVPPTNLPFIGRQRRVRILLIYGRKISSKTPFFYYGKKFLFAKAIFHIVTKNVFFRTIMFTLFDWILPHFIPTTTWKNCQKWFFFAAIEKAGSTQLRHLFFSILLEFAYISVTIFLTICHLLDVKDAWEFS